MPEHKIVVSREAYRELLMAFREINPHMAVLLDGSIDLSIVGAVLVTCGDIEAILGPPGQPPALRDTSPCQDEADEPPAGRPVRAVVELPTGVCSEKELVRRLQDVLRWPIKVLSRGGYQTFKPVFKSYSRVAAAERIKERGEMSDDHNER